MSYTLENYTLEELDAFMASVRSGPQGSDSMRMTKVDLSKSSPCRSEVWAIDRDVPAALFRSFGDSTGDYFSFFIKDKFYGLNGTGILGVPPRLRFEVNAAPLESERKLVECELKKAFYVHGPFGVDRTNDPDCSPLLLITEIEFQYPGPEWPYY